MRKEPDIALDEMWFTDKGNHPRQTRWLSRSKAVTVHEMEFGKKSFLCLLIVIELVRGESLYYKTPKDREPSVEIRGNSFGLENFLIQAYKDVEEQDNNPVKQTKMRDNGENSDASDHRGQTYGLENLSPNLYEFRQPQWNPTKYSDYQPGVNIRQEYISRTTQVPQEETTKNDVRKTIRNQFKQIRKPMTEVVKAVDDQNTELPQVQNPQNEFIKGAEIVEQKPQTNEAPVAGASYSVPEILIQEIPILEKEADQPTTQRPRKRITMRRRRKRPTQAAHGVEKITLPDDSRPSTEDNDTNEVQKENEVPPPTLITTTTTKTTTEKVKPLRKRPSGFRRVNPTQWVDERLTLDTQPLEAGVHGYKINSNVSEVAVPITYILETTKHNEEPFDKLEATIIPFNPEETTASDLKTILKQQKEPLSLSELLQTQNLSLSDLLKNRKEAALLLTGKRGVSPTTSKTDVKQRTRPVQSTFSSKSRPFSKNQQEPHTEAGKEQEKEEQEKPVDYSNTEKSNHNGFVPKNPRLRYGHFKGAYPTLKTKEADTITKIDQGAKSESKNANATTTVAVTETSNHIKQQNVTRRFNDLRMKLRVNRRKYQPFSTTNRANKEEKTEAYTITTPDPTTIQFNSERSSTTEEVPVAKKVNLRMPFKSSNNPELSLLLLSKNKSEENLEKQEKFTNISNHHQTVEKFNRNSEDFGLKVTNKVERPASTKILEKHIDSELPIDVIDMDKDQEVLHTENTKESSKEIELRGKTEERVEVVGKIPLHNEQQKYDFKDEIVELLKTESHSSDKLHEILESRNMTVKELLQNREKSSLQSNFSHLFNEEDEVSGREHELKSSIVADSTLRVFDSLPNFQQIHRNLYQKNVKELKSNLYPDSQIEESNKIPVQTRRNFTAAEQRGSKQLGNRFVEIKKKIHVNTNPDIRPNFENNEGIDQWNTRDKHFFYNPFPGIRDKSTATLKSNEFPVGDDVAESDIILLETIKKSEEANNKLKSNIDEILQEQYMVRDIKDDSNKSFIPPAIKSAIIASGIVMGLALIVFIVILAACGWKQRQTRLRARSSILNDALAKSDSEKKSQRTKTLSPVNFKQSSVYKKSLDMDDGSSSTSVSSNASSYLWNTLKNTFTGRSSMLKSRLEKEGKGRDDGLDVNGVLKNKSDILVEQDVNDDRFPSSFRRQDERYGTNKSDCAQKNSSFKTNHFNSCTHGH